MTHYREETEYVQVKVPIKYIDNYFPRSMVHAGRMTFPYNKTIHDYFNGLFISKEKIKILNQTTKRWLELYIESIVFDRKFIEVLLKEKY